MRETDLSVQNSSEHTALGFAVFALVHAGCGDAVIEVRPDEHNVVCWYVRCGEVCVFASR